MAENEEQKQKRGWIFDQLMLVGSLEAGMNHNDEEICNIYNKLAYEEDEEVVTKLSDQLNQNREIISMDYLNRVDTLNQIFDAVEGSNRHYFCQIKHRATTYIMAAENYHARGCCKEAEDILVKAGEALALTCSLAFGFEPMDCLRCLSDSLAKMTGIDGIPDIESEKKSDTITL